MEFHYFPNLPKEIRLEIWQLALPGPRIIELTPRNGTHPENYVEVIKEEASIIWTAKSAPPSLLNVCCEARYVALETYEPISAWDEIDATWRRAYVDYFKDMIYFNMEAFEVLVEYLGGESKYQMPIPINLLKASSLWIDARCAHRYCARTSDSEQGHVCGGRIAAIKSLVTLFTKSPKLEQLLLVINGRHDGFEGPDRFVEPTEEEHEDYSIETGLEIMVRWISRLAEEIKSKYPSLVVPSVQLKLLINGDGKDTPVLERRWDYRRALCGIRPPVSKGHSNAFLKRTHFWSSSSDSKTDEDQQDREADDANTSQPISHIYSLGLEKFESQSHFV